MAYFKTRLTRTISFQDLRANYDEENIIKSKSSQESLYSSSLPDEKIELEEEFNNLGSVCGDRKTSSMTDIDRFYRYYCHINNQFNKRGSSYPWNQFATSILSKDKLNLDLAREQLCENILKVKISTPKANVRWFTPKKIDAKNSEIEFSKSELPVPGKVKDMVKYFSSPELCLKLVESPYKKMFNLAEPESVPTPPSKICVRRRIAF